MSGDRRQAARIALRNARQAAYPPGQYVQQESFATARDVLSLARQAGVGHGTDVLDLCCGRAGFGRYLAQETGCRYVGVDRSSDAIAAARRRTAGLPCRFITATIPPIPRGTDGGELGGNFGGGDGVDFDVVLLLETLLAFPEKDVLAAGVASVLRPGGRFACTVEAGPPLNDVERAAMPHADTVWPIRLTELVALLAHAGLAVSVVRDDTATHLRVVDGLLASFAAHRDAIAAGIGESAIAELMASHRLWSQWMGTGRIRKYSVVARKAKAQKV